MHILPPHASCDEAISLLLNSGISGAPVVDPENGTQPLSNEDGSVWVVFNGEIYNFVDLREELKAKGHHFKSRCDTEVLVHLWLLLVRRLAVQFGVRVAF